VAELGAPAQGKRVLLEQHGDVPLRRFAAYAAILARHNALFREFAHRERINRVLVYERLDDPALFVDACHFTPEGIDRLAGVFEPAVADLVMDRPAFRHGCRRPLPDRPPGFPF
jgi:hypothetical protein